MHLSRHRICVVTRVTTYAVHADPPRAVVILEGDSHNTITGQILAWIVLLSTILGQMVDQSEYVFGDAWLHDRATPKALPKKLDLFDEHWVLIMIIERILVLYFV